MEQLVKSIKKHEGFRGEVYQDHLGFDTVGFGTKMPIDEDEGELLLHYRLKKMINELEEKEPYLRELPGQIQEIIAEMCYQLGVRGVLKFKKMWIALKKNDYKTAAVEMLDSKWAIQTPNRAKELAEKIKKM